MNIFSTTWIYVILFLFKQNKGKVLSKICLLIFYAFGTLFFAKALINVNRIPNYDISAKCTKLGHSKSKGKASINICFGSLVNTRASSFIEYTDCAPSEDRIEYIFSKENIKSDSLINQAYGKLKMQNKGQSLDSVTMAYDVSLSVTLDKYIEKPKLGIPTTHSDKLSKCYSYSNLKDTIIGGLHILISNAIYANELKPNGELTTKMYTKGRILGILRWYEYCFLPYDLSQCVVNFRYDSNIDNNNYINIVMSGASRFSSISPIPDTISMDRIVYVDSMKIVNIKKQGVSFYALRHDMNYVQYARVFFTTSFLGLFLTLFVKSLAECVSRAIKEIYYRIRKKKKNERKNAS